MPLSIAWAIPDHPWVDAASGAAVRIAMTVGQAGETSGELQTLIAEGGTDGDAVRVELAAKTGRIHADLTIGADLVNVLGLRANSGISQRGLELGNAGFIVTSDEAAKLQPCERIRPYRNGRDLTDAPRGVSLIDLYGLSAEEVRAQYPAVFQWLLERVKPEREQNRDPKLREYWWLHRRLREDLRAMLRGLPRYIATVETAKHRVFQFLDAEIAPDNMLVCIALADAYALGVLSSQVHVVWALAAGSRLGIGNDPRYNKTRCFDPFPFPAASPEQQTRIAQLAEELDALRKRQQAAHPALTLTGMYNVLAKMRSGEALTAKDKAIHDMGLVAVLRQLHDELDHAVLTAYGWQDLIATPSVSAPSLPSPPGKGAGGESRRAGLPPESPPSPPGRGAGGEGTRGAGGEGTFTDTLLERLVALNAERTAEEAAGYIRWLRPEFQNPTFTVDAQKTAKTDLPVTSSSTAKATTSSAKQPWPATLPEQVRAIADALHASPQNEASLAARFTGKGPWKKRLPEILAMLAALGRAKQSEGGWVG